MASKDPESEALGRLVEQGVTYREIARKYGMSYSGMHHRLKQAGVWRRRRVPRRDFWEMASTTMVLIREGVTALRDLRPGLQVCSTSTVSVLVARLVDEGLVARGEFQQGGTLHLTEKGRRMVSLIRPAKLRADGVLVAYKYGASGGCEVLE